MLNFNLKALDGTLVPFTPCSNIALQLPIDYELDKNVFVVLRDDGTYSKGTYTDPSTDTTNRQCKVTLICGTEETALIQKFCWENTEGYIRFKNVDVFLNGVKDAWQKVKLSFVLPSRETKFEYRIELTLELMP